ncbi:PREDICTED: E3 ubiquitin-protein ligase Praja-2-like [Nicotiana attenuata]|uniref:RING-type E3 ubiquitin transferase n=1 Tax=Nicotiana attenuata TaxID=49451 RepID=A0A1J6KP37_NICAT|nr:PREDICTED: E3 ubiquitin-protein ligase Praja-2-like [Nicotiana attenuata]XP_019235913.1 PREDICTED: E3 ubiquitin-protein ligase Praja-2-like [Nicotiana attenuata]OIT24563.1 putative e3 ubiquitin-protein ligase hip1 [Nicotiana attenuata]
MDEYSAKRTANGLVAPRRGLRETADNKDKNVQYCTRVGCTGRVNYMKSSRVGCMEKARQLRPAFGSSNGKEVVGSSSMTSSTMPSAGRSCKESHRKSLSNIENKQSDTISLHEEPVVLKQTQSSAKDTGSSKVILAEIGSSSGTSSSRPRKIFGHRHGSFNQKSPMDSSVSSSSKSISAGTRGGSSSGEGYRLRNLKCNSVSDVLPYSCSPSESSISRRDTVKRRNAEGESSSSSKGKKMSGASPNEGRAVRPATRIFISDSRNNRSSDFGAGNRALSVRTRRSMNVNTRLRGSLQESLQTSQNLPQPETPTLDNPSSSSQFFTDSSSSEISAYSLPRNDDDDDDDELPGVVPFTSADVGINRFMNRDALQRYNMDGVAQVLLALERIEQDEELSYERLLALETNLFLSGLNFYDQHRGMRLDIDDMSYEELLALEERIGSVSTALPEEALSKCLRKSTYQGMASKTETYEADGDGDDIKCSICQEEYVIGDEIGKLGCEHGYHLECITQWFRLKNWCPICKATAAPSESSKKPS